MRNIIVAVGMLAGLAMPLLAQEPDGSDISKAIPVYFGQSISDIGDDKAAPYKVYKITLARGQQFTVDSDTEVKTSCCWRVSVWGPNERSVASLQGNALADSGRRNYSDGIKVTYSVPAAGSYFVVMRFEGGGIRYTIRFNADGTPIAVPNPTSAGCLTGRVDSMLYSLQKIALGLPDEVTVGGTRACTTCTVKPPQYPEIASRMEGALRSGVNVEACYDSGGGIFQLKLVRP